MRTETNAADRVLRAGARNSKSAGAHDSNSAGARNSKSAGARNSKSAGAHSSQSANTRNRRTRPWHATVHPRYLLACRAGRNGTCRGVGTGPDVCRAKARSAKRDRGKQREKEGLRPAAATLTRHRHNFFLRRKG